MVKDTWHLIIWAIGILKLVLGTLAFTPVITALWIRGFSAGFDMVFWAAFWAVYILNAVYVLRLQDAARLISIGMDFLCIVLYWKAFLDIEIPLDILPSRTLAGLLSFCFIVFLLFPKVKAHFALART
ncbi:MAG: hypothetical protein COV74_02830 [Candidatus Omnitrophica bacterium CG11_big_fil_rev_8_21_14_0_20_45_26]|uniref:Uncharacterized protein n=1 Tax=Candidatus Abzuiibacterium crystallinum TaxID=1974748 RepID=A0A2H0LR61_9BACT|nr:MAG: hypothetical protein COV74_02830 [Candidatus Omnitrophica bacterium CG11_big_fil_rev_8_21_14_0_20_45_26]PIW65745.1 MAG: hypothetical protein COW12_00195 [Candidatus Omnitrophica bacterium CG12_big_fil_rev_8_21_14_0_65_45_16]